MRHVVLPLLVALALLESDCAYRLPPHIPPSRQRLRILAPVPTDYTVRVTDGADYRPSPDGRVVVEIPAQRASCGVYLFDVIKIRGSKLPVEVAIIKQGKKVRTVQMADLHKLARDEEGYSVVKMK